MLVLGVVAGSFPAAGVASTTATDELAAALSLSPFLLSRIAASFVLGDASSAPTLLKPKRFSHFALSATAQFESCFFKTSLRFWQCWAKQQHPVIKDAGSNSIS
jgi:hypothetical protein